MRNYFRKVALHHGLEFAVTEYDMAEDPGSRHDVPTFYVTNLREPVARSISHFKYDMRWDCRQMVDNKTFVPTEQNARNLSDWNERHGFHPPVCRYNRDGSSRFGMSACAVDCYVQWFAGLSCPWWDPPARPGPGPEGRPIRREVPRTTQRQVALEKLRRYNFVVITERLGDREYAAAVERLFGVPGAADRTASPYCEVESHYVNKMLPLAVGDETLRNLTRLNEADIGLYREISDCSNVGGGGDHKFPEWDPSRFVRNESIQLDHEKFYCRGCNARKKPGRDLVKRMGGAR